MMRRFWVLTLLLGVAGSTTQLLSQRGGPPPPPAPRAAAPIDLTGYWVSLVTEDWRFRVVTPPKGDYTSVPLNPAGRKVADGWDPAKDEASGESCKAYGAGGVMRLPGRLRITWVDDRTLKLETEAGTQSAGALVRSARWDGWRLARRVGRVVGSFRQCHGRRDEVAPADSSARPVHAVAR